MKHYEAFMIGGQFFAEAEYVSRCGHLQRSVLVPPVDGEMARLVPHLTSAAGHPEAV